MKKYKSILCLILVMLFLVSCKSQEQPTNSSLQVSHIESIMEASSSENSEALQPESVVSKEESETVIESSAIYHDETSVVSPPTVVPSESEVISHVDESSYTETESILTFISYVSYDAFSKKDFDGKVKKADGYPKWYYLSRDETMQPMFFIGHMGKFGCFCVSIDYHFEYSEPEYDNPYLRIMHPWIENDDAVLKLAEGYKNEINSSEKTFYKKITYDAIEYTVVIVADDPNIVQVYWTYDGLPFRAIFYDNSFSEDMLKHLKLEKVDLEK